MRKLLITAAWLIAITGFSADLSLTWVNGTNAVPVQTQIHYGITPGVYTESFTVAAGLTNCTVTNLLAGKRYYFAAKHFDPVDGDTSVFSNEANGKTKMNPPKNLNANP